MNRIKKESIFLKEKQEYLNEDNYYLLGMKGFAASGGDGYSMMAIPEIQE
eukprot:CAMPEP_0202965456 /NCGR_PEP_ID=MMETSP1396-20130829/9424_1 /ASSEMBLY_ACC=CAM_ASM_000872 /TAXON_ID= /ORGANISM="Pseudokeronopsis sp., Strain Brazil" /LENGTH=49 /DNA_ID=CAMNT_0049688179 /DNA_START=1190 /DNA_END=1339 /DNA_ORIENTATION=+